MTFVVSATTRCFAVIALAAMTSDVSVFASMLAPVRVFAATWSVVIDPPTIWVAPTEPDAMLPKPSSAAMVSLSAVIAFAATCCALTMPSARTTEPPGTQSEGSVCDGPAGPSMARWKKA